MIAFLRGSVLDRTSHELVVDVGGVGYAVTVSGQCSLRVGQEVALHVRTQVRDDAIQLFGFQSLLERDVFDLLISVPSIGPAKAIHILQVPAEEVVALVRRREAARVAKLLPGVGKKTAERMIVDLADKFESLAPDTPSTRPGPSESHLTPRRDVEDLQSALVNLGFRPVVADGAAQEAIRRLGAGVGLPALLKEALGHMTR